MIRRADLDSREEESIVDATGQAMRLIIDGYVVLPDAIVGAELEGIRDAFEGLAAKLGTRTFAPTDVETVPEFLNFIGHPSVMPVVDAYMDFYGEEPAVANLHLCRDAYEPGASSGVVTGGHLHNDGSNAAEMGLSYEALHKGVTVHVYLDDTFPDAGGFAIARGSYQLTRPTAEGSARSPNRELVFKHCPMECLHAPAGTVVLVRSFTWHGAGFPPNQKRRQLRADYTPKRLYDAMDLSGEFCYHQRLSDEAVAMLPDDRRRYVVRSKLPQYRPGG